MRCRYWIQEHGEGPSDSVTIDVPSDPAADVANSCAEDFVFVVEREARPYFSARPVRVGQ